MISYTEIEKAIGKKVAVSSEMQTLLASWDDAYSAKKEIRSVKGLHLPASICAEMQRLTLAESTITASDSQLQSVIDDTLDALQTKCAIGFALGGIAFKPYYSGGRIAVDIVRADRFFPIAFDSAGRMQSAVFVEQYKEADRFYYRLECHEYDSEKRTAIVSNYTYCSNSDDSLGIPCTIGEVPIWADMQPVVAFENIDSPLFAYFKIPKSNRLDAESPLGVSVFADALPQISQADRMWGGILWEYQSKETAVQVSQDYLNVRGKLSEAEKRLYQTFEHIGVDGLFNVYSPEIRDSSYFNGLNRILQRIEFSCGLAYGTISNAESIEKTATELKISQQRSYVMVSSIQQAMQKALEQLAIASGAVLRYYGINISNTDINCTWGDSVLEDTEKEFQRRLSLAQAGYLKPEKLIAWYFGCSEEDAAQMIPDNAADLFGGGTNAVT